MTATEDAPKTLFQKHGRTIKILVVVASLLGAGATFFFYKRYADVWLRHPPRMPRCMAESRGFLTHDEENVSGSIPHMTPDGTMVYLKSSEARAVRCMSRISSETAAYFSAAFAEVDPDKRARAIAAISREHIPADPSGDAAAIGSYLISTAALRALPKNQEIDDLYNEVVQRNACRFSMRTPCPARPPMPLPVWIFGTPSSVGLVVSFGWGAQTLASRFRAWREKRRLAKKPPEAKKEAVEETESDESDESDES